MNPTDPSNAILSARGLGRRSFLHRAGLIAAATPLAAMLLGVEQDANADPTPAGPSTNLDIAILNFALNLEYLEGEYYNLGAFGKTLLEQGVTTTGPQDALGTLTAPSSSSAKVSFDDTNLQQYAEEIAMDEVAHIKFLQAAITELGGNFISEPAINLIDSFNEISSKAGLGSTFNPFANQDNFFLGGFSLTDVGVTAYHGASGLLYNNIVITSAAGILGTEAYHDAVLRLGVFQAGADAIAMAQAISTVRALADNGGKPVRDQGVADPTTGALNLTPADGNSIVFARHFDNVLNIVCGGAQGARMGGFFPGGVNGTIV